VKEHEDEEEGENEEVRKNKPLPNKGRWGRAASLRGWA